VTGTRTERFHSGMMNVLVWMWDVLALGWQYIRV
jgi:hypothetical protein